MNTIPDLVPLYDSRPGLRTLLPVTVSEPNRNGFAQEEAEGAERAGNVSQKETKETKGEHGGGEKASSPQPSPPEDEGEKRSEETDRAGAVLDFVSSTARLDRYREIIEPDGWQLDSYRRNPVFQNAHNYGDILFTLGKALSTEVRTVAGSHALCQRIQFATEVNPVSRIAYGLYKGGFLNAVSVGFIPLRWEDGDGVRNGEWGVRNEEIHLTQPSPPAERGTGPRRRYLEQELLEVSAVAIPANPDALALGIKSGAIAKSDLQETLELLRALAGVQEQDGKTAPPYVGGCSNQLINLAREFRRVMQKA